MIIRLFIILMSCCLALNVYAANRTVNLVVGYKTVDFAGKPRKAIAVNNQIPAPTLHFKEGDHVTINVYNHLNKDTAIHWHGLLVPWQMDGVEGISQKAIPPGGVFHYRFTLYQSGTYWYHAHAGFQEQQGLYGAIIIDPSRPPAYHYNKDYVVVLSDWSNTAPEQIYENLKKEGGYYSSRFPLQPSLMKFIHDYHKANSEERKKIIDDYKMMQQMRMSIYDFSDVAYDAYLLNGRTKAAPWTAKVKVGDVVRLRFIGAAGSTIYRVKIPGTTMEMVQIDGNNVKPYTVKDFSIAPGETYDVLVRIKRNAPYIIYAESIDTLGKAYGALITSPHQFVDYQQVRPFPEPEPVTREMMDNMMMAETNHGAMNMSHTGHTMQSMPSESSSTEHNMDMSNMDHNSMEMNQGSMPANNTSHSAMPDNMKMDQSKPMKQTMDMNMPTEPTIGDDKILPVSKNLLSIKTTGTKYQNLIAAVKTNNPNKPIAGVIRMELFGYMDRYIWFINGAPEYKAKPILIKPDKRYRIIFINNTMMHHPMHLHGHWFILRNGHGDHDPLLHTIDVAPGATAVADFDTDASGQWFFHCHQTFHMMAGMARVFQYSTLINIEKGRASPQNVIAKLPYANQAIVRVDKEPIDMSLVHHPMAHPLGLFAANWLDINTGAFKNRQEITYKGLFGGDFNKLELYSDEAEINKGSVENANIDIFYWHLISQFWAIKGGANYVYRPANTPYWQPGIGIEGLMPYFIATDVRAYYHNGSAKLDVELSRDTQITNNFFIRADVRSILATKTVNQDAVGNGINEFQWAVRPYYRLNPATSVYIQYQDTNYYAAFKRIFQQENRATNEKTVSVGVLFLF